MGIRALPITSLKRPRDSDGRRSAPHAPKSVAARVDWRPFSANPTTNALVGQIRLRFNDWIRQKVVSRQLSPGSHRAVHGLSLQSPDAMAPTPEDESCHWEGESEFPSLAPQPPSVSTTREPVDSLQRTQQFRIDPHGRFTIPGELFPLIEDLFPAEFRQEDELRDDVRGQLTLRRLVAPAGGGDRTCWARNYHEIGERLTAHGVQAEWILPHRLGSEAASAGNLRNGSLRLLATNGIFERCRFAQFEVNGEAAAVEVIADFCRAFPDARVIIPVTTRMEANRIRRMLRQSLPEWIGSIAGLRPRLRRRINVATPRAALSLGAARDAVVLIPFLADAPRNWMRRLHAFCAPARVYLVRQSRDRDVAVQRELELRYGPLLTSIERATHQYTMVNFGGTGSRTRETSPEGLEKRGRYWQHDRRNQFIASLGNEMRTRYSGSSESEPAGIVLVENLEHGRQLQRWLQDWPLIGRTGRPAGGARYVITTLPAIERATPRPRWVINAMGGPPSTYLLDWLDRVAGRFFETHLIDLTDGFRVETGQLAVSRERRYRDAGLAMTTLPEPILGPARQNAFG